MGKLKSPFLKTWVDGGMPHFECQEGIIVLLTGFLLGSLRSLSEPEETIVSPKKIHPLCRCTFLLPNLMLFLVHITQEHIAKYDRFCFLTFLLHRKHSYPLAVHLPMFAQVKEILKKHASIRAI